MATIADIQTLVVQRTGRPELVALTRTAIRTATLRAHHTDFFPRDGIRQFLEYPIDGSKVFADISDLYTAMPTLRAVKTVYCVDFSSGLPIERLDFRTVGDEYDHEGRLRQSIFVIHGTMRIYPRVQSGKIQVIGFANPTVSDATFSSWIADSYPEEIAAWASAIVLQRTGSLEQAQVLQRDFVIPFKEMLVESHLLAGIN